MKFSIITCDNGIMKYYTYCNEIVCSHTQASAIDMHRIEISIIQQKQGYKICIDEEHLQMAEYGQVYEDDDTLLEVGYAKLSSDL